MLVLGVPRSATTWTATVLGRTIGTAYVEEPDNHFRFGFAFRAKRRLGQGEFPFELQEEYGRLWDEAFHEPARDDSAVDERRRRLANAALGRADVARVSRALRGGRTTAALRAVDLVAVPQRRAPRRRSVVVKSVYAHLVAEALAARYGCAVVVMTRDPRAILSSWVQLRWLTHPRWEPLDALDARVRRVDGVELPPLPSTRLGRAAWVVGLLSLRLQQSLARNPTWRVAPHEELAARPVDAFQELAQAVGLEWGDDAAATLARLDAPGSGHELRRVAAQASTDWRDRLDAAQLEEIDGVLAGFPIRDWRTLR